MLLCAVASLGGCLAGGPDEQVGSATVGSTRKYFVAAEPVEWNYAPGGLDPAFGQPVPSPWGDRLVYPKIHYVQYTDGSFTQRVEQPAWSGILGPTLHAAVGDTLQVTFLNRADRPLSMHPHGVRYEPQSEGAQYLPGGEQRGIVGPGDTYVYSWLADENAGPVEGEPSSKVWLYHSHVMGDEEIYRGLVGTIVVTDRERARDDGTPADVDQEIATLFMVFNENGGEHAEHEHEEHVATEDEEEGNLKHSINGRFFANLPGLDLERGKRVRWYVVALGTEVDIHTPHWHGETVTTETGSHTDVLELLPASMRVVDMIPDNPGTWLYHCHVADHMMAGMYAQYTVH